jgi:hypothetical protein
MTAIFDTILTFAEVSVLIPTIDVMSALNLYQVYQLHNEFEDVEGASPTLLEHRPKYLAAMFPLSGVTSFADRPSLLQYVPVCSCDLRGPTTIDSQTKAGTTSPHSATRASRPDRGRRRSHANQQPRRRTGLQRESTSVLEYKSGDRSKWA